MGKGDHPKTYLLKALCCQGPSSWLKVRGWMAQPAIWWPPGLYCHILGLGVLSFPNSQAQAQSQTQSLDKMYISIILSGKSGVLVRYIEAARPSHKGSIIMTWVGANFTTKDVCSVYIIVWLGKRQTGIFLEERGRKSISRVPTYRGIRKF